MQLLPALILPVIFLNVRVEVASILWWGTIAMLIQYWIFQYKIAQQHQWLMLGNSYTTNINWLELYPAYTYNIMKPLMI